MKNTYNPGRGLDGIIVDQFYSGGHKLATGRLQDVNEVSTVQNFDIGTRLAMDDRAFRYAKAAGNIVTQEMPVINSHIVPDDMHEGAITGVPVIGDKTIKINDSGAAGARPVNYYAGGFIHIFSDTPAQRQTRRIIASTVGDGAGPITLTLDWPLTGVASVLTVTNVDAYPSMYSEAMAPGAVSENEETFIGFPCAYVASGSYFWVQTWGPVFGHYRTKYPGERGGVGDRGIYFDQYGYVITAKSETGTDNFISYQYAGYIIPVTKSAYGSVLIMLQLAP